MLMLRSDMFGPLELVLEVPVPVVAAVAAVVSV